MPCQGDPVLEALGFSQVDESVYELLVTRGRLSLAEVIDAGDAKPHLRRQALDTLVSKGLVRQLTGPEQAVVDAPPEYAFEVLIGQQMAALQAVRATSAELGARVRRITQDVDPSELIEIVSGEGSVRQLFLQVIEGAREEIAVFDRPPYAVSVSEAQ